MHLRDTKRINGREKTTKMLSAVIFKAILYKNIIKKGDRDLGSDSSNSRIKQYSKDQLC